MKRVQIVVEGQTEQEFVESILVPHFITFGIYDVIPVPIHTSRTHRGGFVNYQHLKNDVRRLLDSNKNDFIVTTFVDFFRIPDVPEKEKWLHIANDKDKVQEMQNCIDADVNDRRFFSYIQLHEFEALLFSGNEGFEKYFSKDISTKLKNVVKNYDNPEDINGGQNTAPSKRLLQIYPEYDKVLHGNAIALELGINVIMQKCPRFKFWIEKIIKKCSDEK